MKRLLVEVRAVATWLEKPFHTVYIGGGNPGCLEPEALGLLLDACRLYGVPDELTVEMNPESLTDRRMDILARKATRLSMGVQSLSESTLRVLGRNSTRTRTLEGMERARFLKREHGLEL